MRVAFAIGIVFGVVGCGATAVEEGAGRESEQPSVDVAAAPAPEPPGKDSSSTTPAKPARGPFATDPISGTRDPASSNAPAPNCTETVLEASGATAHEHLAKALDLCFTTKGDLSGFAAEGKCATTAGYTKAKVKCCDVGVASEKAPALPAVTPVGAGSGFGASSTSSGCPGATKSGSAYAVEMARACAKTNMELTSL